MQRNPSVLPLQFAKQVVHVLAVIPADAGIQMLLKFLDSARAGSASLPGMTIESPARLKTDFFGVEIFQELTILELIEKARLGDVRRF